MTQFLFTPGQIIDLSHVLSTSDQGWKFYCSNELYITGPKGVGLYRIPTDEKGKVSGPREVIEDADYFDLGTTPPTAKSRLIAYLVKAHPDYSSFCSTFGYKPSQRTAREFIAYLKGTSHV